tara:strand:+ start:1011 stop:1292 length:282 start_codon:yes stop_codon:yes gene_type:complete
MQKTNYITTNEKNEALKLINKIRLANKNKWYFIELIHNNKKYEIKGFGTWLQLFKLNLKFNRSSLCIYSCVDYSNCMDQTISQYKEHILNVLD